MSADVTESEDFDLECMCGLLDAKEEVRAASMGRIATHYREDLFRSVIHKFPSFSEEDAAEIVQDAFIDVWTKVQKGEWDPDGSLKSLLFTITRRRGVDELRKRTAKKRSDDEMAEQIARDMEGTAVAAAWKRAVVNGELAAEIMESFRRFVGTLSPQQRLVAEALYSHPQDTDDNAALVRYIRERTGKVVTAMMVKGAKQALIAKFREMLKQKGLLL